nr:DUF4244 domain-containing protein [Nonomuraea sp. SYSU D8015]
MTPDSTARKVNPSNPHHTSSSAVARISAHNPIDVASGEPTTHSATEAANAAHEPTRDVDAASKHPAPAIHTDNLSNETPTTALHDRATSRSPRRRSNRWLHYAAANRERGMSTAEYAVGTIAACAFAALLFKVVSSPEVQEMLTSLIDRALNTNSG